MSKKYTFVAVLVILASLLSLGLAVAVAQNDAANVHVEELDQTLPYLSLTHPEGIGSHVGNAYVGTALTRLLD